MKKVLFATTALVASAGVAAADLTFGGSARFGVTYNDSRAEEAKIHNRFTLNIDGSSETDGGLTFFARVRVRGGNTAGAGDSTSSSGVSAPRVGVKTGGFTLAVGNINGALESTPGLYSGAVGLTGLSWGNLPLNNSAAGSFWWDSFSSAGGGVNGVEVIYSANGLGFHVSHSEVTDETSAHVSYNFGDWTAALAVADGPTAGEEATMVTLGGSIGSVSVGLAAADVDGLTNVRVNAGFDVGAGTTVTAYYQSNDGSADDTYGLGFTHSLGGATLAGGVSNTFTGATVADFGVRFGF